MSRAEAHETGTVTLNYGVFVNKIVSLTIVAFSVFLMVKAINMLKRTAETKPVAPMKRLAILLVVLSISSRLCAQVGVEGYTDSIEQRLAEHLRVTAAGRANRLISAGLFAASGTLLTAGGATMLAQAAGAVSLEVTGSVLLAGGISLLIGSGILLILPSRAEQDHLEYAALPAATDEERADRFAMGEQMFRDLSDHARAARVVGGTAACVFGIGTIVYGGYLYGGILIGAGLVAFALPGVAEKEWEYYLKEIGQ